MDKITPIVTPEYSHALGIVNALREAGFVAYFVGGCVRDWLLGRVPKDVDVATNATPDAVEELFPHTRAVGKSFGVVFVHHQEHAQIFCEVATFRSDGEYVDGRRPESVTFGKEEADAERRDFTINGLFFDPAKGEVIDYVSGREDLSKGVIRAIGDAEARFAEDRLRMLRAIRFAARMAFNIEATTWQAICKHADAIREVSWERVNAEFSGMLLQACRGRAFQMVFDSGLGAVLLSELEARDLKAFGEMLGMLDMLDGEALDEGLCWATLFWPLGLEGAASAGKRLRLSTELRGQVAAILGGLSFPERLHLATLAELKRFLRQPTIKSILALYGMRTLLGDGIAKAHEFLTIELERYRMLAERGQDLLWPKALIDGGDLQALRATPGPIFKTIISAVEEAQLNETLDTREAALDLAKSMLA